MSAGQGLRPPVLAAADVPALTADQMREVDRVMVEELRIDLVQMMENAGRDLAALALARFDPGSVTVLAGSGGNGGGGLVAARHLHNRGAEVRAVLVRPAGELGSVPAHQLDILERMEIPIDAAPSRSDLIVDAMIGYSLRGDPSGRAAELIEWANRSAVPVLALDTPSGLDVTTGRAGRPCVEATATMTLALPKIGLVGAAEVGELYLADISVPTSVYEGMGIAAPQLFAKSQIIRIDTA